jgi:drug/metabolite transporter (DMT)-like permease
MPFSLAVSIMMTTAFVTTIIAYFYAGEKVRLTEIFLIIGAFFGVVLLMNPTIF